MSFYSRYEGIIPSTLTSARVRHLYIQDNMDSEVDLNKPVTQTCAIPEINIPSDSSGAELSEGEEPEIVNKTQEGSLTNTYSKEKLKETSEKDGEAKAEKRKSVHQMTEVINSKALKGKVNTECTPKT